MQQMRERIAKVTGFHSASRQQGNRGSASAQDQAERVENAAFFLLTLEVIGQRELFFVAVCLFSGAVLEQVSRPSTGDIEFSFSR